MDFNAWGTDLVLIVQSAQRMADRLNMNLVVDAQKAQEFASAISPPHKSCDIIDLGKQMCPAQLDDQLTL